MNTVTSTYVKFRQGTQWRWHLVANNNRIVANSGEAYHNEADCDHAIALVKASFNSPVIRK